MKKKIPPCPNLKSDNLLARIMHKLSTGYKGTIHRCFGDHNHLNIQPSGSILYQREDRRQDRKANPMVVG